MIPIDIRRLKFANIAEPKNDSCRLYYITGLFYFTIKWKIVFSSHIYKLSGMKENLEKLIKQ